MRGFPKVAETTSEEEDEETKNKEQKIQEEIKHILRQRKANYDQSSPHLLSFLCEICPSVLPSFLSCPPGSDLSLKNFFRKNENEKPKQL